MSESQALRIVAGEEGALRYSNNASAQAFTEGALFAARHLAASEPLLPAGAVLHATLGLNYRGQYASCECTGDPRPSIALLVKECSR